MNIPVIHVGDTVRLKKPHPCGTSEFRILRVGTDIRIVCCGCGRDLTIERESFEKKIATIIERKADDQP